LPNSLQTPSHNGNRRDAEFNPRDAGATVKIGGTLALPDDVMLAAEIDPVNLARFF
jgi:hypothetical protein